MTPEGDFGPRSASGRGYAYINLNAWVVCGAQLLGQFDAALYAAHIEVAQGVGDTLKTVMEAQPVSPAKVYTTYSRAPGLHTNQPAETGIRYAAHSATEEDQHFFHPGIAGAFLCRLYQGTGDNVWLDLDQ